MPICFNTTATTATTYIDMSQYFVETTTSATTSTWAIWNTSNMITTRSSSVWVVWMNECQNYTASYNADQEREVQEQLAQRLRIMEEARAQLEEAERTAKELLEACLNEPQRLELKRHGTITVRGLHHRFRIRKGRVANVDVVGKDGRLVHKLCCHPVGEVPDYDVMLAQKLMLEVCEDEFVKKANVHPSSEVGRQVLEAEA